MTELEELRLRLTDVEAQLYAANGSHDALVNVIIGAVIAGVIALGIQMLVLWTNARQKSNEAKERRQALGQSILIKMMKMFSNLEQFNRHMIDMAKQQTKLKCEPWQATIPLAAHPEKITFTTDEMAMLLSLKVDDFFNQIVSIDAVHNNTIDVFDVFTEKWHDLTGQLPAKNMEGMVGTVELTQEQLAILRPKMLMLNQLIVQMRDRCKKDSDEALELLNKTRDVLKEKLDLEYKVELKSQ